MSDVNADADESVVVEVQPDALRQEIDRAGARQDEIDEEIQARNLDFQLNMRQGLGEVSSPVIGGRGGRMLRGGRIPRYDAARGGGAASGQRGEAAPGQGGGAATGPGGGAATTPGGGAATAPGGGAATAPGAAETPAVGPPQKKRKIKKAAPVAAVAVQTMPTSKMFPRCDWPEGFTEVMMDGYTLEQMLEVQKIKQKSKELAGTKEKLPGIWLGFLYSKERLGGRSTSRLIHFIYDMIFRLYHGGRNRAVATSFGEAGG